jgi:hypothetical protein
VLFELCSLKHAFDGDQGGWLGLMYQICEGAMPEIPGQYSEDLHRICSLLLERDCDVRYGTFVVVFVLGPPFVCVRAASLCYWISGIFGLA